LPAVRLEAATASPKKQRLKLYFRSGYQDSLFPAC